MKRLLLTLALLAGTIGAPFAADAAFARDRGDRDRGDRDRGDRDRSGRWEAAQERGRRDGPRWERPDRRDHDGPRYERRDYDGPPRGRAVRPGGYLPPEYRGAPVRDYPRYRLRPPPEGYAWRRTGDAFVLMDRDGQVFDIIPD